MAAAAVTVPTAVPGTKFFQMPPAPSGVPTTHFVGYFRNGLHTVAVRNTGDPNLAIIVIANSVEFGRRVFAVKPIDGFVPNAMPGAPIFYELNCGYPIIYVPNPYKIEQLLPILEPLLTSGALGMVAAEQGYITQA